MKPDPWPPPVNHIDGDPLRNKRTLRTHTRRQTDIRAGEKKKEGGGGGICNMYWSSGLSEYDDKDIVSNVHLARSSSLHILLISSLPTDCNHPSRVHSQASSNLHSWISLPSS